MLGEFARRRQERFRNLLRVVAPGDVERLARALRTMNDILGQWKANGKP
jgi:hypothetical protein